MNTETAHIKLTPDLKKVIDTEWLKMQAKTPWHKVSKATVIRSLIYDGVYYRKQEEREENGR